METTEISAQRVNPVYPGAPVNGDTRREPNTNSQKRQEQLVNSEEERVPYDGHVDILA